MQQQDKEKSLYFNKKLGEAIKESRMKMKLSINRLALEYDLDRGNLSKIENGLAGCTVSTLWKLSEALDLKFSDFAKFLEEKLGEDFTFVDI